jgi:hypothetical protein
MKPEALNREMYVTPENPSSIEAHALAGVLPIGETAPVPVMTTRRPR